MYVGMIGTRSLKMLLKNFHENYGDLFKKNWYVIKGTLSNIIIITVLLDGQQILLTIAILYFVVLTKCTWTGKNGLLLYRPDHWWIGGTFPNGY